MPEKIPGAAQFVADWIDRRIVERVCAELKRDVGVASGSPLSVDAGHTGQIIVTDGWSLKDPKKDDA